MLFDGCLMPELLFLSPELPSTGGLADSLLVKNGLLALVEAEESARLN